MSSSGVGIEGNRKHQCTHTCVCRLYQGRIVDVVVRENYRYVSPWVRWEVDLVRIHNRVPGGKVSQSVSSSV
jgi:hypothetical protein